MVYYPSWSHWLTLSSISHISISLLNLWTLLCHFTSGILTNSLRALTSRISNRNMGRTFRREKTYGNRRPRLNSHRDLPDYQDDIIDEEDLDTFDEELFHGKLHSQNQNVVGHKDEPTSERD
jgi:hypothetical protein